jgi:MoaA/NifB/PqqE/SkfB family radical SAM enzyme
MELLEKIKDYAYRKAIEQIISLLRKVDDQKILQMLSIAKMLTGDPEVKRAIEGIKKFIQSDHPAKQLIYRIVNYLSYENCVRLFWTLFNNGWFVGGKKRDAFEKENGFRPPFVLILSPTMRCNLRCKGCYTLGYSRQYELEYEVVDRILRECEDLGIYFVTILGGEPLLYPHLFKMMEEHPDIFFQVYTNGTLVNKEVAKRFSELGNVLVVISIEGDEEETDSWRGKGVYRRIIQAFDHLRNERVLIGTSSTVTRYNVEKVSSFEWVDQIIGLGSFLQNYFLYIPVNGKADFDLMVTPEQRDLLRRRVIAIRNTRPIFIMDFWNDGPYVGGCIAAGRRYFHINAKGDIEPCVYTHIAVDNIRNTTIAQALNSRLFRAIRARQPHNSNHLRPCMIIDNPHVLREIIKETNPYFTHPGAEEIYTEKAQLMDEYAARWGEYADKIWATEYKDGKRIVDYLPEGEDVRPSFCAHVGAIQ